MQLLVNVPFPNKARLPLLQLDLSKHHACGAHDEHVGHYQFGHIAMCIANKHVLEAALWRQVDHIHVFDIQADDLGINVHHLQRGSTS